MPYSTNIATYEAIPSVGFVERNGSVKIIIRMTPGKLGTFKIPVLIAIAGSVDPPIQALISCTCTGPRVVLDQTEVRWGNIECLVDSTRSLKITNDSTIQVTTDPTNHRPLPLTHTMSHTNPLHHPDQPPSSDTQHIP